MRLFILQAILLGFLLAALVGSAWLTVASGLAGDLGIVAGVCSAILLLIAAAALLFAGVMAYDGVRARRDFDVRLAWVLDAAC